jgi:short-subunit dehydrogenase
MKTPSGSVIFLTGAAHGIVEATARSLGAKGFRLGLVDRDADALARVAREISNSGAVALAEAADVTDCDALRSAFRVLEDRLGPPNVLVAGAGIGGLTLLPDIEPATLLKMLNVNVVGVANAIDAVLPGMTARGAGHLVGISSVAGFRGLPWMASYSASKAALSAYLEGLRPALKRRGVTVTTVFPGFVRTALTAETPFRKPVKMLEPAEAAEYLVRAIIRRPRDFVFPFSAAFGMGLIRRLPNALFDRMMDHAGPRALTTNF